MLYLVILRRTNSSCLLCMCMECVIFASVIFVCVCVFSLNCCKRLHLERGSKGRNGCRLCFVHKWAGLIALLHIACKHLGGGANHVTLVGAEVEDPVFNSVEQS